MSNPRSDLIVKVVPYFAKSWQPYLFASLDGKGVE
jgi:hypothetical protein